MARRKSLHRIMVQLGSWTGKEHDWKVKRYKEEV